VFGVLNETLYLVLETFGLTFIFSNVLTYQAINIFKETGDVMEKAGGFPTDCESKPQIKYGIDLFTSSELKKKKQNHYVKSNKLLFTNSESKVKSFSITPLTGISIVSFSLRSWKKQSKGPFTDALKNTYTNIIRLITG
jgi:hypothetical protein